MKTSKKFFNTLLIGGGVLIFLLVGCKVDGEYSNKNVNKVARQASVQTVFHIPILKAYFADEWEPDKPEYVELKKLKEVIDEKIKEAFKKQKELENKETHSQYLTDIEKYGVKPASATVIPLQSIIPEGTKLPTKVIVAVKTEKKEITPWDKEYDKDVLSISETANVSPSKAKEILSDLRMEGYSINKDEVIEEETTLLHFDKEWDSYSELDWKVYIEGTDKNIIVGYDPFNGLLLTKPISKYDDTLKRVYVKAGYYSLINEPDSKEVKELKEEIKNLKEEIKKLEEKIEELTKKEVEKRDIKDVTWFDVQMGRVKIERFWVVSAASGVFLGNMKCRKEFSSNENYTRQSLKGEYMGVVLTNAHVANMALKAQLYASKNKEKMWIIFPGYPFVRYTQDSDYYGSPAKILLYDLFPVLSWGSDCAIMITTAVPGYEVYKAYLGDSNKVKEGDRVVMVGNPAMLQKYSFDGIITNTNYSILDSFLGERILQSGGMSKEEYDWLQASSMWFDAEGTGGTSGSGVWAMEGSQKGKVIALHNAGMVQPTSISIPANKSGYEIDPNEIWSIDGSRKLKNSLKGKRDILFKNFSFKDADYKYSRDQYLKKDPEFEKAIEQHNGRVDMPGMNMGIPINSIKRFLNERGIDPNKFGWERLKGQYWAK